MQVILGRCRQQCITQFDMKCRIFDRLVEPVMSYGSQIWGPAIFDSMVTSAKSYSQWSSADKVHVSYLRLMAGVGEGSVEVLLRDFNRCPIMHHWVILAARWFMALKGMSEDRLARCAWVADIELMLGGCRECWTYKLLHTMSELGVIERSTMMDQAGRVLLRKQDIMLLQLPQASIKGALQQQMNARWNALQPNPRTAPSPRIEMCTHAAWVLTAQEDSRCRGSKHLKLCVSFVVLQCLARLRLGWHDLQIRVGRVKAKVPRDQRLCRLCSTAGAPFLEHRNGNSCVEDLKHFVLECPAYRHVRARYSDVFGRVPALCTDMHAIFDCEQQLSLIHI
jgi:hypothetical protein